MGAEARGLLALVSRDRGGGQLALGGLLEDLPQAPQRDPRLALDPAVCPALAQPVDRGLGLAVGRQLHAGGAAGLGHEVVHGDQPRPAADAHPPLLHDAARTVDLHDRDLPALVEHRRVEQEPRRRALAHRVGAGQPVVLEVVVRVGGPLGQVGDEIEDRLPRCRDDRVHGDLTHRRQSMGPPPASGIP